MIKLGKTIRETLSNVNLSTEQKELLRTYIQEIAEENGWAFKSSLLQNHDMTDGEYAIGGYFYLVEDTPEDFKCFINMSRNGPDLLKEGGNVGLDFADVLGDRQLAVLGLCTCESGGPAFVFTQELLNKYPTIEWHIKHAFDWIN